MIPPATKDTYKRLLNADYNDLEPKQLIAQCISENLWIMNEGKE